MQVALIGGTGFVGGYLVEELLRQGHRPALLVRPGSESKVVRREHCTLIPGAVDDPDAVRRALAGSDAVIYLIGLLREFKSRGITFEALHYQGAARTIDTAKTLGIRRFILMSANGVKATGTPYQTTKYRAEQYLQSSGLDWTIFRPSVMFGDPKGKLEFCTQLRDQLIDPPLPAPLFYEGLLPRGAGAFRLAPIHVSDVAAVFVKALTLPQAVHRVYGLCGPDALTWKAIIELLGRVSGKRKLALPAPAWAVGAAAAALERFAFFPIARDQLTMLLEGNTCDSAAVFALFGITPVRFTEASLAYLKR